MAQIGRSWEIALIPYALPKSFSRGRIVMTGVALALILVSATVGLAIAGSRFKGSPLPMPLAPEACPGVLIVAGDNIQDQIDARAPGTTFCLDGGLHRLTEPLKPKDSNVFLGRSSTVVSGAVTLAGWDREGAYWVSDVEIVKPPLVGQCDEGTSCLYPDDVFVGEALMTRVLSLSGLSAGEVYVDYIGDKVYLPQNPSGQNVEMSTATIAFEATADDVRLSGFTVEKFASPSAPAIRATDGWIISDLQVRFNHGNGINLIGTGALVRDSHIHHNGQLGLGGSGSVDAQVLDNEIDNNNTVGYDPYWEAGGVKFTHSTDLLLKGNHAHHNHGVGLWIDAESEGVTMDSNLVEYNDDLYGHGTGIQYEVSWNGVVKNNIVRFNDLRGIYVSSSGGLGSAVFDIYGNTVTENGIDGITLHQANRGPDKLTRNVKVHDNVITMYEGSSGAFDIPGAPGDIFHSGNTFENNDYYTGGSKSTWWKWEGSERSWSVWKGYGHDETGSSQSADC